MPFCRKSLSILFATVLTIPLLAQPSFSEVNRFLDNWHLAAAKADAQSFFSSMAENSIYIGTDASERWTKPEFVAFAKPYFDKGKAWTFKPYDRDLHFTADSTTVWFSELLETQMGTCRGSGILLRNDSDWQVYQYHLSLTVPNDLVTDFKKLVEAYEKADH